MRFKSRRLARYREVPDGVFGLLGRCDTESYLAVYVRGQNSNLQRKSVEPMALQAAYRRDRCRRS